MTNQNIKWRLLKDGDSFERAYWPFIKDSFPNYEFFWSLFIVPSTGRISDPSDVHIRKGVDPLIEEISMIHYTIFRSLCFIYDEKKNPKNESLRNVYFHFGLVIEMVDLLLFKICSLKSKVGLKSNIPIPEVTEEEIVKKIKGFLSKEYKEQYKEFMDAGRPVVFYLHSQRDFINAMVNDDNFLKEIKEFFRGIRDYRNSFIHSPLPGSLYIIDQSTGRQIKFAIKKECVKKYRLFTDIRHAFTDISNIDDFIVEEQLVEKDFYKLQEILNKMWGYLIAEMDNITEQKKYKELAKL